MKARNATIQRHESPSHDDISYVIVAEDKTTWNTFTEEWSTAASLYATREGVEIDRQKLIRRRK